jgi:CheY-like chemotaxis protein
MSNKPKIFIIDDEQVIVNSIKKIASLEDADVEYALDGDEALIMLSTYNFDLIICDIMMPGKDGFQILQEMELNKIQTPIIITTGYSTIENAVKSLYLGAIDFIPKPFTIDEMISLIKRGLRYSKIKNETTLLPVPCPAKYYRLGYSCWMNKEYDGSVLIGATNFFVKTIEPIKGIVLAEVGDSITQASTCAKFESDDAVIHQLYSVLSGRILERNERIIQEPELIEKDPYFAGWIYRILPTELDYEMEQLIPCSSDRI